MEREGSSSGKLTSKSLDLLGQLLGLAASPEKRDSSSARRWLKAADRERESAPAEASAPAEMPPGQELVAGVEQLSLTERAGRSTGFHPSSAG
jgi:hypothetical protein